MKQPRPHQHEAIQNGAEHFEHSDRGQLIMACGSGKTLTALWIAQSQNAQNIIVALPSLQLQAQTVGSWIAEGEEMNYQMLIVGSDKSIGKIHNLTVTTDYEEICEFLAQDCNKIIFTTYHSTQTLADACITTSTVFDFGIIDEAHQTAGHDLKQFGKILNDENGIVIQKRLFMTATPRFFDDKNLISMDNRKIYGEVIYRITTEDAIAQGILSDYKVLVVWLEESALVNFTTKSKKLKYGTAIAPNRYFTLSEFLTKSVEQYQIKKMVSFHKTVELAQSFEQIINQKQEKIKAFHLNNSLNISNRLAVLQEFKEADCSIITNPKILLEGYDLPEIDSILFADVKKAQFEIVQAIGRCLRRYEGKEMGYVLFPIFVNQEGIINETDFAELSKSLSNVVASDSRLQSIFTRKTEGEQSTEGKEHQSLLEHVNIGNFNLSIFEQLKDKLSVRVWQRTKMLQYCNYDEFVEYMRSAAVQNAGINTGLAYKQWAKEGIKNGVRFLSKMPITPQSAYAEYWEGWDKIFEKRGYFDIMPYQEALEVMQNVAQNFGIQSLPKYNAWRNGELKIEGLPGFPERLAQSPQISYKGKGWIDYETYFFRKKKIEWVSYEQAKTWATSLNVSSRAEFYKVERPEGMPSIPDKVYKLQWEGWEVFLGKKKSYNIDYKPFTEVKSWIIENLVPIGVNSFTKWFAYHRGEFENAPEYLDGFRRDITKYPDFKGYDDLFGKEKYFKYQEFTAHEEVKRLYCLGKTAKYIAKIYNVHSMLISKICKYLPRVTDAESYISALKELEELKLNNGDENVISNLGKSIDYYLEEKQKTDIST